MLGNTLCVPAPGAWHYYVNHVSSMHNFVLALLLCVRTSFLPGLLGMLGPGVQFCNAMNAMNAMNG